ncbi:hypothetical protein AGLY_003550 [Aphis glycines]|uniref:FLYWCH-type domain-containing protein n=1 Tax=Aphis glycines TaxID=307491 RepID=A0A6G0TYI3_APHGL|nr:hypothetical protein AGLY_003550 [Aphis glycines]
MASASTGVYLHNIINISVKLRYKYDYLKTVVPPEADELLEYLDCTYVTGTYKKVGSGECIKLRRIKAMYPPEIWNVHESTLNGEHRTNNICESWNNRFKHVVGHNHPTIWKLIDKMRQEISVDIAKIEINDIGLTSKRKENTLEHRLQILCQRSAENEPADLIIDKENKMEKKWISYYKIYHIVYEKGVGSSNDNDQSLALGIG